MKVMRSIVLALALFPVAPVVVFGAPAIAAETAAIPSEGIVEILPIPVAYADGSTAVTVHVVALASNGAPFPGVKLKAEASTGEVGTVSDAGPGLYSFSYTPAKSTTDVDVTLSVKGKSATRDTVQGEVRFTVKGAPSKPIEGTANPAEIVLGKVDVATLTFLGAPAKGDLLVRTSGGEVTNLTNMGEGKYSARFEAPKVNFPQFALITLADAANPALRFGYQKVPLQGAVDYPVDAPANASVVLKIEGKEFGPVKADGNGKAMVPVIVPPGVDKATLVTVVDGTTKESSMDLRVPPTRLLSLFPLPAGVPADASLAIPVRTVVLNADGSPNLTATLSMTVSEGSIGAASHVANGVYEAIWTPEDGDAAGTATVEVKMGDGDTNVDTLEVNLVPRRASKVVLTTDPPDIDPGATSVTVNYAVSSASGAPMEGQVITVNSLGASVTGAPEDQGGGNYQSTVTIDADGAKMGAYVRGEASGNAVSHVALVPGADHAVNDGASGTILTIASIDTFGYPVADAEITLAVEAGGGQLPTTVTTDANGLSQVQYTSGTDAALVRIVATTATGATGATSFLQVPEKTIPVDLPVSGSEGVAGVHGAWEHSAPVLALSGGGAAAVAAGGMPAPPAVEVGSPDAAVETVDVTFWPEEVPPGGTVVIRAIPMDADGKAIPGKTLDVMTSKGDVGSTTETDAIYETQVVVGDDVETELKVSVVAGDAMKLVKVPVNPDAEAVAMGEAPEDEGPAWGARDDAPEPEPAAEPEPQAEPAPKVPKDPADVPFFRARLSGIGSLYSYSQVPSTEPGPLLPQQLIVGGSSGGQAATPMGGELNARMWVPSVPYVGALVNARLSRYAIAAAEFDEPAPDWLNDIQVDVLGRYPFDVNGDQYWVGGKVGVHYNDFMIFTGCLDPGCVVNFDPLGLTGLGVGLEAGLEISNLYAIAGFTQGLASFTVPYSTGVDVNVGYQLIPQAFVDAGFTMMNRRLILEGLDSGLDRGELSDGQLMFKVGFGYSL